MGVPTLEETIVRHGDLESKRLHEVRALVVGEEDDHAVEARWREEGAAGKEHAHHQNVAEVRAEEGGTIVGKEVVIELLGELRIRKLPPSRRNACRQRSVPRRATRGGDDCGGETPSRWRDGGP